MQPPTRRQFMMASAATAAGGTALTAPAVLAAQANAPEADTFPEPGEDATFRASYGQPLYKISVAQWSLNQLFWDGDLDNRDFGPFVAETFGLDAVEWVSLFFQDRATDLAYLRDMKQRSDDAGVKTLLIMVEGEGPLGHPDANERRRIVETYYKWVVATKLLGGHSLRVNAVSEGTPDEQRDRAADGLTQLTEFARGFGVNIIVENHRGLSSNGRWLRSVIDEVGLPEAGTLPDFGNFGQYDKYRGVYELMPYAKAVSAKSWDFNDASEHPAFDYRRLMRIVLAAGYRGYVGIEYEGRSHGKVDGVRLTQQLLEACRDEMTG